MFFGNFAIGPESPGARRQLSVTLYLAIWHRPLLPSFRPSGSSRAKDALKNTSSCGDRAFYDICRRYFAKRENGRDIVRRRTSPTREFANWIPCVIWFLCHRRDSLKFDHHCRIRLVTAYRQSRLFRTTAFTENAVFLSLSHSSRSADSSKSRNGSWKALTLSIALRTNLYPQAHTSPFAIKFRRKCGEHGTLAIRS